MGITKLPPDGSTKAGLKQCIIRPYPMVSENVDRHRSHGSMQQGKDLPVLEVIVEKGVDSVACSFDFRRQKTKQSSGTWEFTTTTPFSIRMTIWGASLRMFWKPMDIIGQTFFDLSQFLFFSFFKL